MGGPGSGRRNGTPVTGSRVSIDVRKLQRRGLLKPGLVIGAKPVGEQQRLPPFQLRVGAEELTLTVRQCMGGDVGGSRDYHVGLERTSCNFGGSRAWFLCPAGCGRRVALLYFGDHGKLACRRCSKLNYRSQREAESDRALRRANEIRKKLGWPPGVVRGHGVKPKGMHWATYRSLVSMHDVFAGNALGKMMGRLDSIESQLARWAESMRDCASRV